MLRGIVVAGLLFAAASAHAAREDSPPNVIFIQADDLGYGDVGCYGQKVIQTPNIDRLAREGMRFTNFYAGSTVCAPRDVC
jgi:arylsulfatase A-like enzyme